MKLVKSLVAIAILSGVAATGYFTRSYWLPLIQRDEQERASREENSNVIGEDNANKTILLTDQAIANLNLRVQPALPRTYWKSIQVPGMVVDLPGRSDRGVITPVTGVVTKIHCFPGDSVHPGEVLFSIRLLSESIHATQSDLFRATQDISLAQAQRRRLEMAGGAIPEARIVEVENQIARLEVAVIAYRRELVSRGLTTEQINKAAQGNFVTEIAVSAPSPSLDVKPLTSRSAEFQPEYLLSEQPTVHHQQEGNDVDQRSANEPNSKEPVFEVEELRVEIGNQVEAGQTLCLLANHQSLAIEGRAFRDETPLLERSVQQNWPVDIDFLENAAADWPPVGQSFYIRRMANKIDPENRTFGFLIPLENQSRLVEIEGQSQLLWRFRPGQKVRVLVRIARLDDVFVLPREAVARDFAEAFVFTQNVNTFERKPVRILAEDRQFTAVANDGSLIPGSFVVQNAADQLNRMTKSQSGDGLPEGYHIHADGSLHKNEDEGK